VFIFTLFAICRVELLGNTLRVKRIAIVEISGGLGNQLFQLGAARHLTQFFDKVLLDFYPNLINPKRSNEVSELAAKMGFECKSHSILLMQVLAKLRLLNFVSLLRFEKLVIEDIPFSLPAVNWNAKRVRYRGYWQNKICANEIRDDVLSWLNIERTNSVGVHLRRGDYQTSNNRLFHGLLSESYFNLVFSRIETASKVVIYSDSPIDDLWLQGKREKFEIEVSTEKDAIATLRDIAGNSIIAISNSTFSWWAAFLSKADCIMVPSEWMPNQETPEALLIPNVVIIESSFN